MNSENTSSKTIRRDTHLVIEMLEAQYPRESVWRFVPVALREVVITSLVFSVLSMKDETMLMSSERMTATLNDALEVARLMDYLA